MDIKKLNELDFAQIKGLFKDPQVRKYSIVGGTLLLCLLYFIFLIIPQFITVAKVSRQVKDLRANVETVENRSRRIDDMRKRYESLQEELGKYSKHLPAEKEITTLLEGFASIAKQSNVRILSITPYRVRTPEGSKELRKYYYEMPVKITAKSGYHQLSRFVSSLEKGKRIIVIDDLQIRYDKNTPRMHNVIVMVKTYVSKEEKK